MQLDEKNKQLNIERTITSDSESGNITSPWQTKVKVVCCLMRLFSRRANQVGIFFYCSKQSMYNSLWRLLTTKTLYSGLNGRRFNRPGQRIVKVVNSFDHQGLDPRHLTSQRFLSITVLHCEYVPVCWQVWYTDCSDHGLILCNIFVAFIAR